MTARLVDRFTTRDGSWEPNDLPYSISRNHSLMYGGGNIPGRGAANHIMVKAQPGDTVGFNTTDGKNPAMYIADASGWVNHPMAHSSSYAPARGEQGPWIVWVNGEKIAQGIGLPDGLHVSTWLITGEGEQQPPVIVPPDPPMTAREAFDLADFYLQMGRGLLALLLVVILTGCLPTYPHRTDSMEMRPYDQHVPCCQWGARVM